MSEPLYRVEYLFRPGAGIRPDWRKWDSNLTEKEAYGIISVLRTKWSAFPTWRAVPCRVRGPVKSVQKAIQRSWRAAQEVNMAAHMGPLNAQFDTDKHGRLVIRMGGAR